MAWESPYVQQHPNSDLKADRVLDDREQIDARYAELLEQNDPAQFVHLGSDVAEQVQENRVAMERGYKLLVGEA